MKTNEKPTILIVDDQPIYRQLIRKGLAELDTDFVEADSGTKALEILQNREVAVIVLDVMLQDMSGYQVAEIIRVREKTAKTPIIFVSGEKVEPANAVRGFEAGGNDYLTKPLNIFALKHKIQVHLAIYNQRHALGRQGLSSKES